MTREIPVKAIRKTNIKRKTAGINTRARSVVAAPASGVCAKSCANPMKLRKLAAATGKAAFGAAVFVLRFLAFIVLAFSEMLCSLWELVQEKCGDVIRKIALEGLFGEAKDGYIRTENGYILDPSKIEVIPSRKQRQRRG